MENNMESNTPKFSSQFITNYINKKMVDKANRTSSQKITQLELSSVISELYNFDEKEIANIINDINNNNIKVAIDPEAIKILGDKNADQQGYNKFINSINTTKNIQVSSISELSTEQLTDISGRFNINKVYVNSGYDVAARKGYSVEKYMNIKTNADLMIKTALGKNFNNKSMSQLAVFKKIYKYVVDNTKYDYGEENIQCLASRNLDHFFTKGRFIKDGKLQGKGRAVCSGFADGLKNLCDCLGIESEYVQGYTKKSDGKLAYHAWIRVKIDGKWYNADPTWDSGKVGLTPFSYCLKTDEEFKNHQIDTSYIPDFIGYSSITAARSYHYEPTTKKSLGNVMKNEYDTAYAFKYSAIRQADKAQRKYYEHKNKEELALLTENKVPTNITNISFKQRFADFLNRGKYIKRIPFVKNFVNKNCTQVKKEEKTQNVQKDQGLYRTEGHLKEALIRTGRYHENSRNTQLKEKEEKQK